VLFVLGQAPKDQQQQLLEAIFDLSRDEVVKRVKTGTMSQAALAAHDYVLDIFPQSRQEAGQPQGTIAV
jgi:malate synthase